MDLVLLHQNLENAAKIFAADLSDEGKVMKILRVVSLLLILAKDISNERFQEIALKGLSFLGLTEKELETAIWGFAVRRIKEKGKFTLPPRAPESLEETKAWLEFLLKNGRKEHAEEIKRSSQFVWNCYRKLLQKQE